MDGRPPGRTLPPGPRSRRERPLGRHRGRPRRRTGGRRRPQVRPQAPLPLQAPRRRRPLSLQVHPDLAQAKAGFEDEERRGVPIDAPHRNYKDANHKPELVCALTPFEGLSGFRPPLEAAALLEGLGVNSLKPYADLLRAHPEEAALREVLTAVLTADRAEMARTVSEAAAAAERLGGPYAPYAGLVHHYPGDPGVIAAMLLNHVQLQPGEAMFLGAGIPHAYLDGLGVELMANSDNVLRCGLTPKHVDVPELLKVTLFEPGDPGILRPEGNGEEVYETPIDEFRLSRFVLAAGGAPGAARRHRADPAVHGGLPEGELPEVRRTDAGAGRIGLRTGRRKGRTVRNRHRLPCHCGGLTYRPSRWL